SKYPDDRAFLQGSKITQSQTEANIVTNNNINPAITSSCPTVSGVLGQGSLDAPFVTGLQSPRLFRSGTPTVCPSKAGSAFSSGQFVYDAYEFTNGDGMDRCITVNCTIPDTGIFMATYVDSFNPSNIVQNFLGDRGSSTSGTFSVTVPAGRTFVMVVSSVANAPNVSQNTYSFSFTGINNCGGGGATLEHTTVYAADTANNRIQRSLDDGMSWETVGFGPGVGLGQFNAPQGVSSDSTDTLIFVADTNNNRIQRSTNGGMSWQVIAGPGTTVGKVNAPQGVAYDEQNDTLYIADTNNNRVQMATSASTTPVFGVFAGATIGTALGKVNKPASVAVDINGGVYVADTANNRIQFNTTLTTGGWAVFAGATAGTALGKVNQPRGIYVDTTGNVYVADTNNNRVQVNMGGMTSTWSNFMTAGVNPGFVNGPQGVVLAASGNVFIGDTKNNRMQKKPLMGGASVVVGAPGTATGNFNLPTNVR
ncbi:MAG: NHL repeat-containing protein, partial [Blastocatellia bacterium]